MSDTNMFLRDDTFFGICQSIGEDFGFNPNWLRLAFGVSLLLNPMAVIGTYFALGVLVLFSRLVVRNPRPVRVTAEAPRAAAGEPGAERVGPVQEELPLAA
jgi:phage shock protein C